MMILASGVCLFSRVMSTARMILLIGLITGFSPRPALANNLLIENGTLEDRHVDNQTYDIEFDISSDNSWFDAGSRRACRGSRIHWATRSTRWIIAMTTLSWKARIRIDGDGGFDSNADGRIDNADFSTRWDAFYMMKYEITQGQYAAFLNMITVAQQNSRHDAALNFKSYRNFIKNTANSPAYFGCDANNAGSATAANRANLNEADDAQTVAANYLS